MRLAGRADVKQSMPSLFWFEAIAVVAFSASWLVKGAAVPGLNDKPAAAEDPGRELQRTSAGT